MSDQLDVLTFVAERLDATGIPFEAAVAKDSRSELQLRDVRGVIQAATGPRIGRTSIGGRFG